MSKTKLKNALISFLAASVAFGAVACSEEIKERSEGLNNKLIGVVTQMDESVIDFSLTGTDVDKNGFTYSVSFNGVAMLDDQSKVFASVNYDVPHSVFMNLEKDSSIEAVYNVFDYIVDNYDAKELNLTNVGDVENFNNAIVKNTPSPFEGYGFERGLVYNISSPMFDDENRSVSFDVKTIIDIKAGHMNNNIGLGIGFKGNLGLGVGFPTFHDQQGTFIALDNYSLSFSEEDYQQLKQDPNFIYEICADAINRKDESFMKVERRGVSEVTYENADLLDKIDFHSTVNELGM